MTVSSTLRRFVQSAYSWVNSALPAGKPEAARREEGAVTGVPAAAPDPEPVRSAPPTMKPKTRPTTKRRSGIRSRVLEAARAAGAEGATRAEVLETLGMKGDPSDERAVSNALSALKKSGTLVHEGSKYVAR